MATYHDTKLKTAQAKAAVARAKARAPPAGPLLLTAALALACFLTSDYLLYNDQACQDGGGDDEEETSLLRSHLWTSEDGWTHFTLSRLFLSGVVFLVLCVGLACILGCCGFKGASGQPKQTSSPI